jgi:hypothetical protein
VADDVRVALRDLEHDTTPGKRMRKVCLFSAA